MIRRVRGVALLTALLVVALATALVAALIDDGGIALARTANVRRAAQADALANGLEDWAIQLLRRDLAVDEVDSRSDLWAQPLPPTPVPGGRIGGRMRDLGGCFNLNNLAGPNGVDEVQLELFRRLLGALKLDPGIADAAADWVDVDLMPGAIRGAEDAAYLGLPRPYRAANARFADASELRLVRGVDAAAWRALVPHVCALPDRTRINANTATLPLLQALSPRLDANGARRLFRDGGARWREFAAFRTDLEQAGVFDPVEQAAVERLVAFSSPYFLAQAEVVLDGIPFSYTSVIERRDARRIGVVGRARGVP
jgi:general secretion pathway protein K